MRFNSIAGLGLLATAASALPRPETHAIQKRSTRLQAKRYYPSSSLNARAPTGTGSSGTHFNGNGWLLTAQVGPTNVTLNIDTGSSDLWVASTLMPSDQQSLVQTGHDLYDPISSSSAKIIDGETYQIKYGDGSHSTGGEFNEDVLINDVFLGGMAIGVCTDLALSPGKTSRDTDGPIGLAFGSINSARPTQQPTFVEQLISLDALQAPMFTTHFKPDDSGTIIFGDGDNTLYTGDLVSVAVDNSTGFWNVPQMTVGSSQPIAMIADTGTPAMTLPSDAVTNYFSAVKGAKLDSASGLWTIPCGTSLSDLQLAFPTADPNGPQTVYVPGSALLDAQAKSGDTCYTYLKVADGGSGSLGAPFFASMYVEWDLARTEIRFAAGT